MSISEGLTDVEAVSEPARLSNPLNYPDAGDPCLKDDNGNLGKFKEHKTL